MGFIKKLSDETKLLKTTLTFNKHIRCFGILLVISLCFWLVDMHLLLNQRFDLYAFGFMLHHYPEMLGLLMFGIGAAQTRFIRQKWIWLSLLIPETIVHLEGWVLNKRILLFPVPLAVGSFLLIGYYLQKFRTRQLHGLKL